MGDALWSPLSLPQLVAALRGLSRPVWIAGGIALEIAAGRSWRGHADIDIMVLRPHWPAIRDHLGGWDIWIADPPGTLMPLGKRQAMPGHVHDIWLRTGPDTPWRFQVMLDETAIDDPGLWTSRHDTRICRPIAEIGHPLEGNVRVLAPEIQLFYKARGRREKDEADFAAVLPILDGAQRAWLAAAISIAYGETNPWCEALAK